MSTEEPQGKAKGGVARAQSLTPEERKAISRKGAMARWGGVPALQATHGSAEHPLAIGDIQIPCYVLEDGTRVLSQRGLIGGLGMSSGSGKGGADRLASFLQSKGVSANLSNDLMMTINNP